MPTRVITTALRQGSRDSLVLN